MSVRDTYSDSHVSLAFAADCDTSGTMRQILMLRHGETDWNAENRRQGWIDIPLNANGRLQAEQRAQQLLSQACTFSAVISSDLARAKETATIIADTLGITSHIVHQGFRERFGGDWQGLTREEIGAGWPEQAEQWGSGVLAAPPNAEPLSAMLQRFDSALRTTLYREPSALDDPNGEQLNRDAERNPRGAPLLLISHGGIQRAVAVRAGARFTGVHDNLAGLWFDYDGTNLTVTDTSKSLDSEIAASKPFNRFASE